MAVRAFSVKQPLLLAAVCSQTYIQFANTAGVHLVPHGYRLVGGFRAKLYDGSSERFGFILESGDSVIVAFRGTVSPVNWIADLNADQKPFPYAADAGLTHQGFTDIYESLRASVFDALGKLDSGKELLITGHSLGGALAVLCGIDAAINTRFRSVRVCTFGAPRVGDPAFAKAFDDAVPDSRRIYNVFDIVPQLPTPVYKSPRTGLVYEYQHVRTGVPISFRNGSASANHVIGAYFAALSKQDPAKARELCGLQPGLCP